MADPPPIRRPGTKPPPLPRVPVAPAPGRTDVVPIQSIVDDQDLGEDTRNLEVADAEVLVERMLEMVASEGEALLAGDDADGRLADLNVRTALASWDALHQADEAMRFLELADRHPLAPRLRFAASLVGSEEESLDAVMGRLAGNAHLLVEAAEAWLWRHGKAARAVEAIELALAAAPAPALARHAMELAALVHSVAGNWTRVVELRRTALTTESEPEEVAATAALVLDRAGDAATALGLCWAKLEFYPGVGTRPGAALDGADFLGGLLTSPVHVLAQPALALVQAIRALFVAREVDPSEETEP